MDEEFEIKIGDEIRDDLPFGQPRLPRHRYRVWGNPEQDDVRIICGQKAYQKINQHACSQPSREVGGVLLGKAYRHEGITYVEIMETISAPLTRAGAAHVTFTPDTWSAVNQEREKRFPELKIVGWYHTHPRMNVFLSGDDMFVHRNFFPAPWQVALVVEPYKHYGGFFVWKGNAIQPASGFYEHFDSETKSIINWRNILGPMPVPAQEWSMVVLAALVVSTVLLAFFTLQTHNSVNRVEEELTGLKATIQMVGGRVNGMLSQMDMATAVAQAIAATQTAGAHAITQALFAQKATGTAVAVAQTAAAQTTRVARSAQATRTAQVARATATALWNTTATTEVLSATPQPTLTATRYITATASPVPVLTDTPLASSGAQ